LSKGATPSAVVDVGGNVGDYAGRIRKSAPGAKIHIFEPSATNVAELTARFQSDSLVRVIAAAVSDISGTATLYSNAPGSALSSLAKRRLDHFGSSFDVTETVSTARFEEYWRDHLQRRTLDLVKLDVEGYELVALKGFGDALKATKVIQFEFCGCDIDTRTFFQDFWYFFTERNFEIYRITPYGGERITKYRESDEYFSTTNYIAVNRG